MPVPAVACLLWILFWGCPTWTIAQETRFLLMPAKHSPMNRSSAPWWMAGRSCNTSRCPLPYEEAVSKQMHSRVWSCALSANLLRLARTTHFTLSCSVLQVAAAASRALEEAPLQQDALFAPSSTPTMKQLQREHEEQYRYQQQQQQVPWLLPSRVCTDCHPKDHSIRVFS